MFKDILLKLPVVRVCGWMCVRVSVCVCVGVGGCEVSVCEGECVWGWVYVSVCVSVCVWVKGCVCVLYACILIAYTLTGLTNVLISSFSGRGWGRQPQYSGSVLGTNSKGYSYQPCTWGVFHQQTYFLYQFSSYSVTVTLSTTHSLHSLHRCQYRGI